MEAEQEFSKWRQSRKHMNKPLVKELGIEPNGTKKDLLFKTYTRKYFNIETTI